MRIVEVINKVTEDSGAEEQRDALLTILVNLKSTAEASENPDAASKVPFSLLKAEMYNATRLPFDWDAFLALAQSDPSVPGAIGPLDHLISSYKEDEITLSIKGGEDVDFSNPENIDTPNPDEVVGQMADRANPLT
jgi:hypothetical protein